MMNTDDLQKYLTTPADGNLGAVPLTMQLAHVRTALRKLETAVLPEGVPRIAELSDKLDKFAARVSLVGQVKAGKTALANGMLGTQGLLPSDVNPWTSVVTSMHVNVDQPQGKTAIFKFFSEDDWAALVNDGGRIAELARKAKFDTKLDELTEQIKEMKRRTETRLGRNFKMLLGNQHSFSSYNTDLIKRYVCLGEDDLLAEKEGRFADLTKSADLYLSSDNFDYPVTIADTPGVNDPFLIREAATLQNLGTSHLCVVVLSAHQALSTVDIGLMRILASLQGEQIIVFVNRVDELPNPDKQIKEIDAYIADMLKRQKLPGDIPVIFGSAIWAEAALDGATKNLPEDSLLALQSLIEARTGRLPDDAVDDRNIDNLGDVTGVSALRSAIDRKVVTDVFGPFVAGLVKQALQVAEQSTVYLRQTSQTDEVTMDAADIADTIADIKRSQKRLIRSAENEKSKVLEQLSYGISGAYREFIEAEKRTLKRHLAGDAALEDWAADTQTLRRNLNDVYDRFGADALGFFNDIARRLADELSYKFTKLLGNEAEGTAIAGPSFGAPGTPVSLMRTLTIDLSSGVVASWFRRKLNKDSFVTQFEDLTLADMRDTLSEITRENVAVFWSDSCDVVNAFIDDHLTTLDQLSQLTDVERRAELQKQLGMGSEVEQRLADIAAATVLLSSSRGVADDAPAALQAGA